MLGIVAFYIAKEKIHEATKIFKAISLILRLSSIISAQRSLIFSEEF